MNENVVSFFCGLIFALGLGIAGMTEPAKVSGFLDLFGAWEPALLFVMVGAIIVYSLGYRFVLHRGKPVFTGSLHIPALRKVDKQLALGAALFGVGWGLVGYCPGPALTALVTLKKEPVIFFLSMLTAMNAYSLLQKKKGAHGRS